MADALTPALALAALVLCVAGVAKLRSPDGAARALQSVRISIPAALIRAFALVEISVGALCLVRPSPAWELALASLYLFFCVLGLALARRHSPCGCFGQRQTPASAIQSALNAALGAAAIAAAVAGAHGVGWLAGRPAMTAGALVIGVAGAVYATVLAYTELPLAWSAWSGGSP